MAKFKTIVTTVGAAKIAAVLAGTGSIVLDSKARMAVGDGNGTLPTPVPSQTALVHEVYRGALNSVSIDDSDPKNIVVELVIPPDKGGFWMRELALYDAAGTLLAVGNMAETYKPSLSEGAGRKSVIRMVIAVSDVSAVTITIDSSTVMATKEYVDDKIDEHEKSRNHPDATLTAKGFTQLSSATNSASETQAATPKAVKTVMDATSLKAPLASPALSGVPTAPTATPGTNTQQLANTSFVRAAIAALINSSPGVLDTLGELAAALGNDANFATTMTNALAGKQPKDTTLTNLSGKDVAGLLQYLGLGDGSALPVGVPIPWTTETPPAGWIKCNGAPFSRTTYPKLAQAYPSLVLPDLRAEFIRGWDDGRGVNPGRVILSTQADDLRAHQHRFKQMWASTGFDTTGGINPIGADINGSLLDTYSIFTDVTGNPTETRPRNIAFNFIVRAA